MRAVWALLQEELLTDCVVSPDVFGPMSNSREVRGGMLYQWNA
jgi:hypothetical protein